MLKRKSKLTKKRPVFIQLERDIIEIVVVDKKLRKRKKDKIKLRKILDITYPPSCFAAGGKGGS